MKTYYVLKLYKNLLPSVVYKTNDAVDASMVAAVFSKGDYQHIVAVGEE
jgi:hypothetical protein